MSLIRSFISLNIESSLQKRLKLIQDVVKEELKNHKIKWEKDEKFHLTLRFLGDTEREKLDKLSRDLRQITLGFDAIKMTTNGIGFFPNQKFPNVVFIDLLDDGNKSELLADKIEDVLNKFEYKPEKKFIPHITLGRFKRENRKRLGENINFKTEPVEIIFESFNLMKSTLMPGGSVYELLYEYKFKI